MKDEYESLIKNQTWKLIPQPKGKTVISCKWVYKFKKDENGRIRRFKARLVGRGFTQIFSVDYDDTYAPVAKLASLRIILTIAAAEDLELEQMDVVAAFWAEKLDTEIYMEHAEGFKQGTEKEDLVCLLL